jgi:hypothetical protein
VLGLCERFHVLPSALDEEDPELIRMMAIRAMGTKERGEGDVEPG